MGAIVVGLLAGGAVDARAGLMDFIWDMSGPQMVGFVARCRVPLQDGITTCNLFGLPIKQPVDVMRLTSADALAGKKSNWWLALEGGIYRSTGKDEGEGDKKVDFQGWKTEMLAFDPMLQYVFNPEDRFRLYAGGGSTFQFLTGDSFRRFAKAGGKLRVGFEYNEHWEATLNLRLYPSGYGLDQFGLAPRESGGRPFEHSWGAMAGYKW